ncbi:MAG: chorismate synthase [Lentisphaeria bacterium]|nr:chorismate synthase [Lentisphaeria bacterium]
MSDNTFGKIFQVTTFGESHGAAIGAVVDGMPAGVEIDTDFIQRELDRRRPGAGAAGSTARKESDTAEILSGVFEGKSTGTPIAMLIRNSDQHSSDYGELKDLFRPGHADWGFHAKYGFRDHRGGGRSSGRETACRVAAGALAKLFLKSISNITISAFAAEIGGVKAIDLDMDEISRNPLRTPDAGAVPAMLKRIEECRMAQESCGGIVECRISGVPAGWGEPVFDKLDALLAHAIVSLGAVKGFSVGSGFDAARTAGSVNNSDPEAAGGIRGGISDGEKIVFRAAVKPTPSISQEQLMPGTDGQLHKFAIKGRHDVCIVPRIVPVVEAMAALVLADCALRQRCARV